MKIITHNGHFHTDELLAVAVLLVKYPDAEVVRSRDEQLIAEADIAVDVGQIYNAEALRFDHHQTPGPEKRENGIPYAALGLVWKKFGEEIAGSVEAAIIVEERLIFTVDALDNGVEMCDPRFEGVHEYTVGDYFESFASEAETMENYDQIFMETLPIAGRFLKRLVGNAKRTVKDWKETIAAYEASEDKRLIILPRHASWKNVLIPTEALFVVYPRQDGRWGAQAVPKSIHGFENKKKFPASWAGKVDDELVELTSVPDAFFCHKSLHLTVTNTKEGAIKLAEIALNS